MGTTLERCGAGSERSPGVTGPSGTSEQEGSFLLLPGGAPPQVRSTSRIHLLLFLSPPAAFLSQGRTRSPELCAAAQEGNPASVGDNTGLFTLPLLTSESRGLQPHCSGRGRARACWPCRLGRDTLRNSTAKRTASLHY